MHRHGETVGGGLHTVVPAVLVDSRAIAGAIDMEVGKHHVGDAAMSAPIRLPGAFVAPTGLGDELANPRFDVG